MSASKALVKSYWGQQAFPCSPPEGCLSEPLPLFLSTFTPVSVSYQCLLLWLYHSPFSLFLLLLLFLFLLPGASFLIGPVVFAFLFHSDGNFFFFFWESNKLWFWGSHHLRIARLTINHRSAYSASYLGWIWEVWQWSAWRGLGMHSLWERVESRLLRLPTPAVILWLGSGEPG